MNRREFLKSLIAIGTSITFPIDLATASTGEVEAAWTALAADPRTFYVSSFGALSSSFGVEYPTTRQALFNLELPPEDVDGLITYAQSDCAIADRLEFIFECARDDGATGDADDWVEWLTSGDEDAAGEAHWRLTNWIEGHPDESDWERADLTGLSGRGDALQFFRVQQDTAALLDIVIVEGCHPGSSYFAAELRMDIDNANALAIEHGIPIRFDHNDD